MDRLPPNKQDLYKSDFNLAYKGFYAGTVHQIPKIGQHIGTTGASMCNLWEWIQASKALGTLSGYNSSLGLRPKTKQDTTGNSKQLQLRQFLRLSRPLAR